MLGYCFFTPPYSSVCIHFSREEIEQFSLGCDSDFEEKSKPDFSWPNTNFSINIGSYAVTLPFSIDQFCQEKTDLKPQTKILLFPNYLTYEYCRERCNVINGKVFYPNSETSLQFLLESVGTSLVASYCPKGFQMPFIRSTKNESVWINNGANNPNEQESIL